MELECALLEYATVQRGRWRDQRRPSVRSLGNSSQIQFQIPDATQHKPHKPHHTDSHTHTHINLFLNHVLSPLLGAAKHG